MGATDGDPTPATETAASPGPDERPSPGPGQDALQVPTTKRRRIKSPTPGSIRGRSMTPIRGRSQTPFSLYLNRRSATPSTWRSITPFLKREDKERTPFELGKDIKQQLFCNKAVFDKALYMDITEPEVEPVRYITSDMSVIDRAAVMDVSNVEVIYVVEEYEEYEEYTEDESRESSAAPEEEKKKKKKGKKSKEDREKTPTKRELAKQKREAAKKEKAEQRAKERKEKKEKSPSPKISLKLEIGGGQKASKKMFEQKTAAAPPVPQKSKPPPKKAKSKLAEQMEKQAKVAAAAAEEAKKKEAAKPKRETYEEKQKRLKAEAEAKKKQEEEERKMRELEEALAREQAAQEEEEEEEGEEESAAEESDEDEDESDVDAISREGTEYSEAVTPSRSSQARETKGEEKSGEKKAEEEPRRGSGYSDEGFTRPNKEEEEKWRKIAEEEGEEFMQKMRKFSKAQAKAQRSEKERDADWQKHRESMRRPTFINFLTDRTAEVGQSVRLACAVSGPDLSIKWFKDGRQVERSPSHRINNNNNILSLEIVNPTTNDCGEYACSISNANDEITSSCLVTVYEVYKDEPSPPTISLVRDFYHLHDDELTIECHIHGIPRPKITWIKDAVAIKPSFKYTLLEEAHGVYKLMIYRPSIKDSGKYICKATNDSGEEEIAHVVEFVKPKTTHIHFLQKEKEEQAKRAMEEALKSKEDSEKKKSGPRVRQIDEPPVPPKNKLQFATQLRDRIAAEGSSVKLMCNVVGPDPAIRWLKDDKPIPLGPKVKNLSEGNKAVLELKSVSSENSGLYKCIAKNPFSEIDTQCYLKVYSAKVEGDQQEPMFVLPMRDVYHSSENDLVIDTKVRGNPRPKITWLRDEMPVVLDARVQQIEHLDGICELIINKPTPHDGGNYICVAENSLGTQKITHKVVIENIPVSRRSSGSQTSMVEEKELAQPKAAKKPEGEEKKEQKGKPPKGKKKGEADGEGGGRRRQAIPEPSPKEKLYFIANLPNHYHAAGSKVKLQAVVGGPDPQIKWLKNGGIVPYGPRIKNLSKESIAILEISNAKEDDSGEYTVVARNPANEISTSALLHVYQVKVSTDLEPMFTRALKDTYRLNTNELIIESHVRGEPRPTIVWYKDSVEIEKSEKHQIIYYPDGTCELIVDKPNKTDTGKYLCKAENRAGEAEISHYVYFEGKEAKIAENIHGVFHADKSLIKKKETVEEPAAATGEKPAEEKKEEGGKPTKGKKAKPKGAKAEAEPAEKDGKPAKEEKREKRVGIHFGANLTDRAVAVGSKVKLTCYVEGADPQVRWFKDDQPLVYSPKVRQNYREGLCTLEFLSAAEADTGRYKCYAKDVTGEASTICNVNVYAATNSVDVPPTFTRAIKDTYNSKINELVLNVHLRGLPTPTVNWVKDGVRIEPSEKYQQIQHADGTCELVINDPIPYDSGKYVCQAENRKDKAEIVHMVHVEAKNLRASPAREPPKKEEPAAQKPAEEGKTEEGKKEEAPKDAKKPAEKKKGKKAPAESGGRRSAQPLPDPKKKLNFGNFLSNRVVAAGEGMRWTVYINGPDPQVRWFRNDQPIVFGPKSKSACQDGIATLVLSKLAEEDSGEYKLVAKNPDSEITSTCNLTVYKVKKEESTSPVFTVGIKDSYQSHSNQIILECKLHGIPMPKIYWSKNDVPIQSGSKYTFAELPGGMQQLIIHSPSEEDSSLYTCYAENTAGTTKLSKQIEVSDYIRVPKIGKREKRVQSREDITATLKDTKADKGQKLVTGFKQKLSVETSLKDMTIQEENRAKFVCTVQGEIEDVIWMKDGTTLKPDEKHKISANNGLLILEVLNSIPEDSGEYTCLVKNSLNEVVTQSKLNIYEKMNLLKLPESFSQSLKESYDAKRNELILECVVHGRPKVTWFKDNYNLSNNRYRPIEEAGGIRKLIIRNPVSSDFGSFTCRAEESTHIDELTIRIDEKQYKLLPSYTNGESVETTHEEGSYKRVERESYKDRKYEEDQKKALQDMILYRDKKRKPVFSTTLCDRTAMENSTIKLTCNILGSDAEIFWMKSNKPLPTSTRYRTLFDDGLASLEIFSVHPDDSGDYACVARNSFGESCSYAHLRVYKGYESTPKAPVFTRTIRDTYFLGEDELVLDCRVRGNPRPHIEWVKDNETIVSGTKYQQFDQADGYCKLVVNNPTEKDSGVYVCCAENPVHMEKISHAVEFAGREKFIIEKTHGFFHRDLNKPHFSNQLGNHIVTAGGTIAIQAEFAPTNSPIDVQWLRNKSPVASMPNIRTFADRGVYTLAIENATKDFSGTYTCRASNAFGRIESNANVHIIGPQVKGGKPALFLSRPENEMKIAINDPFSISFRVQGEPKPRLALLKGTRDITKSDRVSKEAQEDYIRFTVHNAQVPDSGTYFVVARNDHGTDRIFVTVTVRPRARSTTPTMPRWGQPLENYPESTYFKNPPGPISSEPLLVDSGKNHISLSWGKPHTKNSAPVVAYRVEAWQVGKDGGAIWKEIGVTPLNNFDVFNLKTGMEYHFRVTPKNRYGWGPSVQTSYPILIGGAECLPEFTKILPGQLKALIDKECILECHMKGSPKPVIEWYKDGQKIESTDRVSIRQIGSICKLKINQVFEIDSGRYTCEATNNQGKVSTFARLQVVSDPKIYEADHKLKEFITSDSVTLTEMIPQFTMRLRDRRVQVTHPVRLTCQIMGYPQPELTWYKEGREIENDGRFLICDDGQFNTLEIGSTNLEDSGTYTATAKNELGSVSCHCILTVDKGIRAYIAPDFYVPLDHVYTFQEGNEIRLTAKVEAYPSVGVSWHRNGTRLRPSRKIIATLDHDGFVELIIADASPRDAGIYCCVASNAVGRAESSCRVVIEETPEEQKKKMPLLRSPDMPYSKEPMFVKKPRSSEAYEGDTVIIFCEVVGDPKPDVVWLRDFLKPEYYKDAPHFKRIGDGPEYRLEIPSAKLDFTGTYSVIASNCHGEAKAIISLQIYAKDINSSAAMEKATVKHGNVETLPIVTKHLKDLRCCDGDAVTLECHVGAVPEPIVLWEKDGRTLPSDKDFIMAYDGARATLSIPRVYPEDEGEYTCVASNTVGRGYSSACIIVDVPEEKENLLSRQLSRPAGLFLSACSTPRSTPRSTPIRGISPMKLSFRHSSIDITPKRQKFATPKFYSIPHNKVAEEGETVRFQCAIAGHPLPWSTWDKDGIIVTQTARISIKERDDVRILEIEEVTYEDAGLYRITLENDYGRIEATARLDVIGSTRRSSSSLRTFSASPRRNIHLSRRLMGNSTRIGGRLALACGFRGSSVPARKFYHNGEEVVESERIAINLTDKETSLTIENVTHDDEGIYTCVAQNEFGLITTSTEVVFFKEDDDIPCEAPKVVNMLPSELHVTEGKTVDLAFELDSTEPYSYTWTRDGQVLCDSDEFRYMDHGNGVLALRIFDPFDMDAGLYACTVKTEIGSCSTFCRLIVEDDTRFSPEIYNLEILKHPLPAIGVRGAVVSFCARVAPANATVKWSVCGREITCDSREFSLEDQQDGVKILHILGIDHQHSGEIKAVVHHPLTNEEVTTYAELAVIPSPVQKLFDFEETNNNEQPDVPAYIVKGPNDCSAFIGGTVILDVLFGGTPPPKVKWLKAGHLIAESTNAQIKTNSTQSRLILTHITADDSGKYSVEIMNEHSSDFAVASVAVEGPPEPPSGKPSVSQGPDRIAVAWCGPPYDGGCVLTGFIVEMQEAGGEWKEIASVVDSLAYTVKNVSAGIAYKFRVRAENVHGRSEPSQASDEVSLSPKVEIDGNRYVTIRSGGDFKSRFETLEELGKGRFGIVYKVLEKDSQQILAAKIIKCIKAKDRIKVQEEISIMKSLQHPKLLQLAASFESPREIIMVMEYITGGELFERVVADDFTLTERDCILFVRQICEGVQYMHDQCVVHLDLKPENIMCHTRTSHQIKIIDFGLAQRLTIDTPVRVLFGTPEFIPPEIINYEPISFQSDMWSVGVICYVLLSGLSPFMGDSDVETFANITRADYDFDDDAFDAVSQEAKDFISNLLIHRKEDRLTATQCLESTWLSKHDNNLSNNKICTDKLKKFIIRRKWQKTGNAIRALGRMATLSASRRNSSASVSFPSSPRPSICAGVAHTSQGHPMSSVNEEEDDFDSSVSLEHKLMGKIPPTVKMRDKTQCSERSDSGFSECSNCSGGGNIPCLCSHSNFGKPPVVPGEIERANGLSVAVPHDVLKTKLEEIVKAQGRDKNSTGVDDKFSSSSNSKENLGKESTAKDFRSSLENFIIKVPQHRGTNSTHIQPPSAHDGHTKEPLMKSDFINTVKMRKKSLENSMTKEKTKPKTIFEPSGKVSMLKSKFNTSGMPLKPTSHVSTSAFSSKSSLESESAKPKSVFERLASNTKTTAKSLPGSPLPSRAAMRLTGRVKDVTERLTSSKSTQPVRRTVHKLQQQQHNPRDEAHTLDLYHPKKFHTSSKS